MPQITVCCPSGRAFDVVVDLRPASPTFLKWSGAWLSRATHIVVPAFCAHGFFAREDGTAILYLQGGCFAALGRSDDMRKLSSADRHGRLRHLAEGPGEPARDPGAV
jgi:hypothetical protein